MIAETVTAIRRVAPKTAPAKTKGEGSQLLSAPWCSSVWMVSIAAVVGVRGHLQGGPVAGAEGFGRRVGIDQIETDDCEGHGDVPLRAGWTSAKGDVS